MIPVAETRSRTEWRLAIAMGCYAALVALAPGWPAKLTLSAPLVVGPLAWWILQASNRWLLLFFGTAWLLPPLPVALGNSGPHIAVLIVAVGLLIGILRLTEWRIRNDSLSIAILTLFAVLLGSISLALIYSGLEVGTGSFVRVLLFAISVYIFFYVRSGPALAEHIVRVMFWMAVASALFACIDFYFQFPAPAGYGPQFVWLDTGVFRRAQGFFYEASTLGNFCAFFLVMALVALSQRRRLRILRPLSLMIGGIILAAAIVLSYSRASLVNVAVASLVLLWLNRGRLRVTRLLPTAAVSVAVAAALIIALLPEFSKAYWQRIWLSAQFLFESPDAILSGRLRSWAVLQDFLVTQPWHAILGVGYKTLPYSDFIGNTAIADNTYLSILVETGIGGLIVLCALHWVILRSSYRAALAPDPQRSFLGTWILCFWSGQIVQMLSGDLLTYWRVLPAYFCVLALATRDAP